MSGIEGIRGTYMVNREAGEVYGQSTLAQDFLVLARVLQ